MKNKITLLSVLIVLCNISAYSQTNDNDDLGVQEVQITKSFIPQIPSATKINLSPTLSDTIKTSKRVSYFPIHKRFKTNLNLNPIKAAKIKGEPISKLYNTYIYGGVGNMSMPTSRIYYSSDRDKKTTYALALGYKESYADIKSSFDENQKVSAAFRETDFAVYAKTDLDVGILNAYINREGRIHQLYGYDPTVFKLDENLLTNQQYWGYTSFSISFKSKPSENGKPTYFTKLYAYDLNENTENTFSWLLDLSQSIGVNDYSLSLGVDYDLNNSSEKYSFNDSLAKELILTFSPSVSKELHGGQLNAGFEFQSYDSRDSSDVTYAFYPLVRYDYHFSENYQKAFVGVRGGLQENSYWALSKQNPYILNALSNDGGSLELINSQAIYDVFLGMESVLSKDIIWSSEVSYSRVLDMPFFELDMNSVYQNKFKVVYDDVNYLNWSGNLNWKLSEKANADLELQYNKYELDSMQSFAYKPSFLSKLKLDYNIGDKIIPAVEVFTAFGRSTTSESSNTPELDNIIDFNLSLEYRYNSIFSAYFKGQNLVGGYHIWQNYPVLGPQVFFGLSFKL
jgi:hypothetical protein